MAGREAREDLRGGGDAAATAVWRAVFPTEVSTSAKLISPTSSPLCSDSDSDSESSDATAAALGVLTSGGVLTLGSEPFASTLSSRAM